MYATVRLFVHDRSVPFQNVEYGLITKPDLRTSENNGNLTVNVVYKKSFRLYSNENHQIHGMESNAFLVRLVNIWVRSVVHDRVDHAQVHFMVRYYLRCFL